MASQAAVITFPAARRRRLVSLSRQFLTRYLMEEEQELKNEPAAKERKRRALKVEMEGVTSALHNSNI